MQFHLHKNPVLLEIAGDFAARIGFDLLKTGAALKLVAELFYASRPCTGGYSFGPKATFTPPFSNNLSPSNWKVCVS